ncbi:hypothetical protein VTK73DRAFT_60 [Phialemonium thermophilum]|uniref:Uncharacterized protein n=1 Tax=Phialemonium thermophilum TaxID=223376 RepID=A0ABR3Y8U3_9PEZI
MVRELASFLRPNSSCQNLGAYECDKTLVLTYSSRSIVSAVFLVFQYVKPRASKVNYIPLNPSLSHSLYYCEVFWATSSNLRHQDAIGGATGDYTVEHKCC